MLNNTGMKIAVFSVKSDFRENLKSAVWLLATVALLLVYPVRHSSQSIDTEPLNLVTWANIEALVSIGALMLLSVFDSHHLLLRSNDTIVAMSWPIPHRHIVLSSYYRLMFGSRAMKNIGFMALIVRVSSSAHVSSLLAIRSFATGVCMMPLMMTIGFMLTYTGYNASRFPMYGSYVFNRRNRVPYSGRIIVTSLAVAVLSRVHVHMQVAKHLYLGSWSIVVYELLAGFLALVAVTLFFTKPSNGNAINAPQTS